MQHFVYRIEDINGTGPYRGKTSAADSWFNKTICNHSAKKRPGPGGCEIMSEMYEDYLKEYCFAFSTMKQLERWFPKTDRDLLHDNSYYISLYSVPREFYIRATNQCIFIKEKSTLVKKIDIKEYYTKLTKKVKKS